MTLEVKCWKLKSVKGKKLRTLNHCLEKGQLEISIVEADSIIVIDTWKNVCHP